MRERSASGHTCARQPENTLKSGSPAAGEALVVCPDCELCQLIEPADRATIAICVRCGRTLRYPRPDRARPIVGICACAALGLLLLGYALPIMSAETGARYTEATLMTGPDILLQRGEWQIALVLTMTLLLAPIAHAMLIALVWLGRASSPRLWSLRGKALGLIPFVSRWSMLDIFLAAVIVAWTRLSQWLWVRPRPALFALVGAALVLKVATRALLPQQLLHDVSVVRTSRGVSPWIAKVQPREGLHGSGARDPSIGLTQCGALTLAGFLLYVPANVLPIITIRRITEGGPTTIMSGVEELFRDGSWFLGAIVFLASVAVPLLKLCVLAALVLMTLWQSSQALRWRMRLHRFIVGIGRWSMLDIFVLSLLVSLVRLGTLGYVAPEPGALAFCAVVVITMVATEVFEPKLMWAAAARNNVHRVRAREGTER